MTVLVVDDDRTMRDLITAFLSPAGYEIREAADADTALDLVRAGGIDVVVADIKMPGRDGIWLVDRLREHCPATAIVLATGATTLPGTTSLREGVVAYLLKPFTATELVQAVKEAAAWRTVSSAGTGGRDSLTEWLTWRQGSPSAG